MPVFSFERLYPHPPLAQNLLVDKGAPVALDPVHVALVPVAQDLAATVVLGAFGSQRA